MSKLDKLFRALFKPKKKTLVVAYGRLNPPSFGHYRLVETLHKVANSLDQCDRFLLVSHTSGLSDPLIPSVKLKHIERMFPDTEVMMTSKKDPSLIHQMVFWQEEYSTVILVVGEDRVAEFDELLTTYNGKKDKKGKCLYKFDMIKVVSCGFRDPDSHGVAGVSASKMRKFAKENDYNGFVSQLPPSFPLDYCKELFDDVKKSMR